MKILLDENLPHDLRPLLTGHDVYTVTYMGWCGLKNGALLARAGQHGFDALVSLDASMQHQQNVTNLPLSIVVLVANSSEIDDLKPLVPELLRTLSTLPPKTLRRVP